MNIKKAKKKSERQLKKIEKHKNKVDKTMGYVILWLDVNYQIEMAILRGLFETEVGFFKYSINEPTKRWVIDKLLDKGYTITTHSNEDDIIGYITIEWKEED